MCWSSVGLHYVPYLITYAWLPGYTSVVAVAVVVAVALAVAVDFVQSPLLEVEV